MPRDSHYNSGAGAEFDPLNPDIIAEIATRLFNEFPETPGTAAHLPGDVNVPAADAFRSEPVASSGAGNPVREGAESLPGEWERDTFTYLPDGSTERQEPLGHHASKLTDQQNYAENKNGSYGLEEFIKRSRPANPGSREESFGAPSEGSAPFFNILNSGLPAEDEISFSFLYDTVRPAQSAAPPSPTAFSEEHCYARELFQKATGHDLDPEYLFQAFRRESGIVPEQVAASETFREAGAGSFTPIEEHYAGFPNPFGLPSSVPAHYYFLNEPETALNGKDIFDVASIRRDFPVLQQKINGKPLAWLDNAATTQKPLSVINAVAEFYATSNSNIHRGAHTLAARATDAYEGAREKIRRFIGAGSVSEIIFVRGTTEGINLVAQTWGRKFIQPGDEIVLSILEHHANIVPWQMLAQEKGARIRVAPVNEQGEIILEEYARLLNPRTRFVSLTQASNGLGTVLPVREMIQLAKRFDAKVLIDGAQSVAHTPVNVQDLDADFFVFSGHKIFAPTGIGALYGKKELLDVMPPWQGGGNMIQDVRFEETIYSAAPAKFEAGTPSIGDAVGLGAALDYVGRIGLENIARYEHELTRYATGKLQAIPGLRLIGTAREKVGVLSFVLNTIPNEEVGKILDREGIAVRAGHHCTQPSLRRFGVEGTVRPSLAFYNTREEIDRLADVISHIQRR